MSHKYTAVLMFAALAFGLLLLFGLGDSVSATTVKLNYSSNYDCGGADDSEVGAADNSCTAGTGENLSVTADVETVFDIPTGHTNYANTRTILASPAFNIALDPSIPNGAYVGYLTTTATIALLNGPCVAPVPVTIPFFDANTDTTNTVDWTGDGSNLTVDSDGNGLAEGIDKYPSFLNVMFNGRRPLARYYGYTITTGGSPPTQLNFVIFAPGVLQGTTSAPGMPRPDQELNSSLGYLNYVALNNPVLGSQTAPSSISDICSPLNTTTRLFGKTAGEGRTIAPVGPGELSSNCRGAAVGVDNDADTVADDGCIVVNDACGNGVDNDADTKIDEYCVGTAGLYAARTRSTNPTSATSGIYSTGTHMAGAYLQGYRDADADGIANEQDSCPTIVDGRESGAACVDPESGGNCSNAVDDDADAAVNDGCPASGPAESGANCNNATDDDADTLVNDGCPTVATDDDTDGAANDGCARIGTAENYPSPNQCSDAVDNDGDTLANDGCPPIQVDTDADGLGDACDATPAVANTDPDGDLFLNRQDLCPNVANPTQADTDSNRCSDAANSDTPDDTAVNDGCPQVGAAAESGAQCGTNTVDNDGDTVVNDGCPLLGFISESCVSGDFGPCSDSIGDLCDPNPTAVDGDFDKDMPRAAVCIGAADADNDGWCDATETLLGSSTASATSVPEYAGLNYPMVTGAPQGCSNLEWYASAADPIGDGAAVDDDADTLINAADAGCNALVGDADQDGVVDASDNCSAVYNPDQTNSDTAAIGGGDALGDACDPNDDGDGLIDTAEWARGSDAKNPFSPFMLDIDGNGSVQGADASALKAWIGTSISAVPAPSQVCLP
jgi:hypothetical protein